MPHKNPEKKRLYQRLYIRRRRKENNAYGQQWRKSHPERRYQTHLKSALKRKYNLSLNDFKRMLEAQHRACAICFRDMDPPHVDHDHKTGQVRGLLCRKCNHLLGYAGDQPHILGNAIAYLTFYKEPI